MSHLSSGRRNNDSVFKDVARAPEDSRRAKISSAESFASPTASLLMTALYRAA